MVASFGLKVCVCAPFGGESGDVLTGLIEREGIDLHRIEMAAPNGAYVHDRRSGERVEVACVSPPPMERHELDDLYNAALVDGLDADVVVLGGPDEPDVLDAGTYRRLATDLTTGGATVVADLSGDHLFAVAEGGAAVVKASHEDLVTSGHAKSGEVKHLRRAIDELASAGAQNVVISRADEPALALADGRMLEISTPSFASIDHRGAGDSMTAGIAAGLALDCGIEDALRLGAAAGTLNATRRGLATGEGDLVERLTERVTIRSVD